AGRGAVGSGAVVGRRHRPRGGPLRGGAGLARARLGGDPLKVAIRVAVAGAAGRMGQTVCRAVESAPDMELTGRADPALNAALADTLANADVLVDFTVPTSAITN